MNTSAKTHRPSISVVLAVYKAEAYIDRCLDSLMNQTFKDVEYIFVSDASPDRSIEHVMRHYETNDWGGATVRTICNPVNRGVGFTRQTGLDNATGEYVIHVDPDDWVEPDYLESMYAAAKSADADIVFCDMFREFTDRQVLAPECPRSADSDSIINQLCRGEIVGSTVNELVRRGIIAEIGARFVENVNVCEDLMFVLQLHRHPLKVVTVPRPLYHYDRFTNSNSIQRSMLPDHLAQDNRLLETIATILPDTRFDKAREAFMSSAFFHIFEIGTYSNRDFHHRYSYMWPIVRHNDTFSIPKKTILFLACHGLYRQVRALYRTLKRLY